MTQQSILHLVVHWEVFTINSIKSLQKRLKRKNILSSDKQLRLILYNFWHFKKLFLVIQFYFQSEVWRQKFIHFASPFVSSYWVVVENSNLVYRLIVVSPSLQTTNVFSTSNPRWWTFKNSHVTRCQFWSPIHVSGMAEARAVKFCNRKTIPSLAKWMTNPPNGANWAHVTNFLHAQLWTCKKISPWSKVNNAVDHESKLFAPTTIDASDVIH